MTRAYVPFSFAVVECRTDLGQGVLQHDGSVSERERRGETGATALAHSHV